jgi:hypothetical protein
MLRGRRQIAAAVVPIMLASTAVAVAAITGPPISERVQAQIVFHHAAGKGRSCEGKDGQSYFENIYTVTGTVTGDEQLTGDAVFHVHAFVNEAGEGFDTGSMRISNPETGAWKAQGRLANAYAGDIVQGIITGQTRLPADSGGERFRLFAGFRVTFHPDASVTAQIGGEVADTRLPAVQVGGRCTGPFERFEFDIPAPGGDGAAQAAVGSGQPTGWRPAR